MSSLLEFVAAYIDGVVESVRQEANDYLPIAKQLRGHILKELELRVAL